MWLVVDRGTLDFIVLGVTHFPPDSSRFTDADERGIIKSLGNRFVCITGDLVVRTAQLTDFVLINTLTIR